MKCGMINMNVEIEKVWKKTQTWLYWGKLQQSSGWLVSGWDLDQVTLECEADMLLLLLLLLPLFVQKRTFQFLSVYAMQEASNLM